MRKSEQHLYPLELVDWEHTLENDDDDDDVCENENFYNDDTEIPSNLWGERDHILCAAPLLKSRKSQFQMLTKNPSLLKNDWIDQIVWDSPVHRDKPVVLFDVNDENMVFSNHLRVYDNNNPSNTQKMTETKKNQRKSKKRAGTASGVGLFANQYVSNQIIHAEPALKLCFVPVSRSPLEILYLHRPDHVKLPRSFSVDPNPAGIPASTQERPRFENVESMIAYNRKKMRKKSSISLANQDSFILTEYATHGARTPPLFLGNPGMGSRITGFYRQCSENDTTNVFEKFPDAEKFGVVEKIGMTTTDRPHYLWNIPMGGFVQAIENNLSIAPAVLHGGSSGNDFLLVKNRKTGKFYLREISATFSIGQVYPKQKFPPDKNVDSDYKFVSQESIVCFFADVVGEDQEYRLLWHW